MVSKLTSSVYVSAELDARIKNTRAKSLNRAPAGMTRTANPLGPGPDSDDDDADSGADDPEDPADAADEIVGILRAELESKSLEIKAQQEQIAAKDQELDELKSKLE